MENTLKSGTCPKCGSGEVYTTNGIPKRGDRMLLVISSFIRCYLDTYLCTNCGHFEEYINDSDVKDEKLISKVKETWNKVK
jgi:predicted nucleic-acid-binding Zn-ribbon protein